MYLPLFESFEEAGNYAWGAAALAFLYRALGNACVKSQSTICGCLTLLQVLHSLIVFIYLVPYKLMQPLFFRCDRAMGAFMYLATICDL